MRFGLAQKLESLINLRKFESVANINIWKKMKRQGLQTPIYLIYGLIEQQMSIFYILE